MVFNNLPIEIDKAGQARMRAVGVADPFGLKLITRSQTNGERERFLQEAGNNPHVYRLEVDPLTRASERLGVKALIDFEQRRVIDARVENSGFRGYEQILKDRAPSDVVAIASRVSGQGSGANSIAAAQALEMAYGITPPPLATIVRSLGAAAECVASHVRHLFMVAGPDYSAAAIAQTNPSFWLVAQQTSAAGEAFHGFRTIGEIMTEMNVFSGHLYREALHLTRTAAEVAALVFGKYPHPSTVFPGGVGIEANRSTFQSVLGRINQLVDYAKKVVAVWDDLIEFLYAADPRFQHVGETQSNFISSGLWDDPAVYEAGFDKCNAWGERRMATPGVIVKGKLRTNKLTELSAGIEEFADHSFFSAWNGHPLKSDPLGVPLSPLHPWNKLTIPVPDPTEWSGTYSWNTAPRWDREPMETGALARQWVTAISGKLKNEFIHTIGSPGKGAGLEINLPKFQLQATRMVWQVPERANALERIRARAYHVGYCSVVALTYLLKAFDSLQRGETAMSKRFRVPQEALGASFWEDGQGSLMHYVMIANSQVVNYQIVTASGWMSSPQDAFGTPGPYEKAMISTPLIEDFGRPEECTGIDLLRAIRSFDP
ncbi:MAG TPA: nickel-dependent hydrogenase large subunit [Blastocatellia bacterium]|nr:nickel-dependent hydrogenase large subunit [Blastocatellia bacterium]